MRKLFKNEIGITLIALVITIIILLILAGVTIVQLTGNGLFDKAKQAKEKLKEEQEKENLILGDYESAITSTREDKIYDSNIYDEWRTWLYLAGIKNPEIYNEKDILSDESIVNAVMNNQNAVDYMIKSKYFIMPAVCNSELAMNKMSNISYIKYKIIEDQSWIDSINNSEYGKLIFKNLLPKMSSNQESGITVSVSDIYSGYYPYHACDDNKSTGWVSESGNYNPHWFKIEYDNSVIVTSYILNGAYNTSGIIYTFYMEASNDGINWTKLEGDTIHQGSGSSILDYNINLSNKVAYKYYRVYFPQGGWTYGSSGGCPIYELDLYGMEITD